MICPTLPEEVMKERKVTPQDAAYVVGLKNTLLPCLKQDSMSCSDFALFIQYEHVKRGKIKVLPFLNLFLCSRVSAPGVDSNGVILLSVTASLTHTDHFSSTLVYHSILSCSADFSPHMTLGC